MRIAAPPEWADRTLSACEVGGDPFRVAFDSLAQAEITRSQYDHLVQFSGIALAIVEEEPTVREHAATRVQRLDAEGVRTAPSEEDVDRPDADEFPKTEHRQGRKRRRELP